MRLHHLLREILQRSGDFNRPADQVFVEFVVNPQDRLPDRFTGPDPYHVTRVGAQVTALAYARSAETNEIIPGEPFSERERQIWPVNEDLLPWLHRMVRVVQERHSLDEAPDPQLISDFMTRRTAEELPDAAIHSIPPELFLLAKSLKPWLLNEFNVRVIAESIDPDGRPRAIDIAAWSDDPSQGSSLFTELLSAARLHYFAHRAQRERISDATRRTLDDLSRMSNLIASQYGWLAGSLETSGHPVISPAEGMAFNQRALPAEGQTFTAPIRGGTLPEDKRAKRHKA